MKENFDELDRLVVQARRGDRAAESKFRARMEPAMRVIADRALSNPRDVSNQAVEIRRLADQMDPAPCPRSKMARQQIVGKLAGILCEILIRRLPGGPPGCCPLAETRRN